MSATIEYLHVYGTHAPHALAHSRESPRVFRAVAGSDARSGRLGIRPDRPESRRRRRNSGSSNRTAGRIRTRRGHHRPRKRSHSGGNGGAPQRRSQCRGWGDNVRCDRPGDVPDVPAGRYIVRATRDGFANAESSPFTVEGGSTEQVLVEMRLTFVAKAWT